MLRCLSASGKAAGSLLGMALSSISIAVPAGKVERKEARSVCANSSVERVDGSAGSVYSAAR